MKRDDLIRRWRACDPTKRTAACHLQGWTKALVDAECGKAYRQYERRRKDQYAAYFSRYPHLRSASQEHSACNMEAALPPGWGELQRLIPRSAIHLHARSAKSSQTLALSLLGSATTVDPSLRWFWTAADLIGGPSSSRPSFCFERSLAPDDLNERPHTTQLDFAIEDDNCFVAVESKWTEKGFDVCSCRSRGEGDHEPGGFCANRVLERTRYWQVAQEFFGLPPERLPLLPCQIAPIYQTLRNVTAARHLAGDRPFSAFVLLYDSENPFFRRTGRWPGWPALLRQQLNQCVSRNFLFRALSWQELILKLPLDQAVRRWAKEKHQLG